MEIVLVRLSALGDVVHTWPLAEAVKAIRPDARLTWVVEEPLRPLVESHPAVDRVVTTATRRWRRHPAAAATRHDLAALRRELPKHPELCIDAQGVTKSALVTLVTGARRRVGLARPWRRELLAGLAYNETVPAHDGHVVARNLELVRALGVAPPQPTPPPDGRWLIERHPARPAIPVDAGPTAVLLPAAGHPSKVLPCATLAAVARGLASAGLAVIVAWGPAERDRAAAVTDAAAGAAHLAPATDLGQLVALLGDAALVVGGDTGPVHLAASLGTPTVAVFTSTDPRRNGPFGTTVAVVSAVDPGRPARGGAASAPALREVTADEVVHAGVALLGGPDRP